MPKRISNAEFLAACAGLALDGAILVLCLRGLGFAVPFSATAFVSAVGAVWAVRPYGPGS